MKKNRKQIVWLLIFILLAFILAVFLLIYGWPKTLISPINNNPPSNLQINFNKTGQIVNWNGVKEEYTNNWQLNYSQPGYNVLLVDLIFNEASLCNLGDGDKICLSQNLSNDYNGRRANILGYQEGQKVIVANLILE